MLARMELKLQIINTPTSYDLLTIRNYTTGHDHFIAD